MSPRLLVPVLTVLLAGLLAAACGGPSDPESALREACERQYEEVLAGEEEGDTPTAGSTEERLARESLNECAGQDFDTAEGADEGDEDGEGETPAEDEDMEMADEGDGEATDEVEEPAAEPIELDDAARELFAQTCGSCHTLEDAGSAGQVGPELTGGGYEADAVAAIIADGQGAMPAGLLSGDDADAVAEYVAGASSLDG